ncbi:MAG: DUF2087 domain-containing protein [Fimbriimonas sp.]
MKHMEPEKPLLARYLDANGLVKLWPAKPSAREEVLDYLASKFDVGKSYSEREVGEILDAWHWWKDRAHLRRELVDSGRLNRTSTGSTYTRPEINS